jgi:hypothetical protein
MLQLLSFGALGIGLAILAYAASLVSTVLKGPPVKGTKSLVFTFMAFSLVAFGTSVFLELKEREIGSEFDSQSLQLKQELNGLKDQQRHFAQAAGIILPRLQEASKMAADRGCPGEGGGIPIPHGGDINVRIGEANNFLTQVAHSGS